MTVRGARGRGTTAASARKVTMKRRFSRHLLRGDEVTWPSEVPEDGVPRLRVPEGDDETTL